MSTQDADTPGVPEPPAKVVAVADQVASAVDHAVPVSDEPANRVLVDNARLRTVGRAGIRDLLVDAAALDRRPRHDAAAAAVVPALPPGLNRL